MLSGLCTRALPSCMCINNSVIVCAPLSRIHTHPLSFSFTPIFVLDCVLSLSSVLFLPDLPFTCLCTHSLLRALSLPRSLFPHSLSFSHTHAHTRSFFHASPLSILPLTLSLSHTHTCAHVLFLPCFSLPDSLSPTHCPQKLGVTPFEYTGYGWEKLPPKILNHRGSKVACLHSSVQAQ